MPDIPANSGVPTALPIRQLQLLGGDNGLKLTAKTVTASDATSGKASIIFNPDGSLSYFGTPVPADPGDEWYQAQPQQGIGNNYEIAWFQVSGDTPQLAPAVEGSFISISAIREYGYLSPTRSGVLRIDIRRAGGSVVLASANITVTLNP